MPLGRSNKNIPHRFGPQGTKCSRTEWEEKKTSWAVEEVGSDLVEEEWELGVESVTEAREDLEVSRESRCPPPCLLPNNTRDPQTDCTQDKEIGFRTDQCKCPNLGDENSTGWSSA